MAAKSSGAPPPPEKIIYTVNEVVAIVRLSRQHISRLEKAGRFPQRVKLSASRVGFFVDEIKAWIASRPRVARPALPIEAELTATNPMKRVTESQPESYRR